MAGDPKQLEEPQVAGHWGVERLSIRAPPQSRETTTWHETGLCLNPGPFWTVANSQLPQFKGRTNRVLLDGVNAVIQGNKVSKLESTNWQVVA